VFDDVSVFSLFVEVVSEVVSIVFSVDEEAFGVVGKFIVVGICVDDVSVIVIVVFGVVEDVTYLGIIKVLKNQLSSK
jgi:hypothetical protein